MNTGKCLLSVLITAGLILLVPFRMSASDKTGRPVRIVSLCFENEDFNKIISIVDEEGAKGVDIIVLPETWRGPSTIESLEGETITTLSELARKHHTYIVSPIYRKEGEERYNSSVLIDRNGRVVFIYDKVFPYWNEFDMAPPATPGKNRNLVFDTDFGRIGLAVCYDVNFPEVWQALRDQGAELVLWSSAYSAGSQLQAYALLHHYYIVSSTYSKDCQVYDITGERILDQNDGSITVASITLDLDRGIYHENFNMGKLADLLKAHGNEVEEETHLLREQWFVLRAKNEGVSARSLAHEFGLEELRDYQDRSRTAIDGKRGFSFTGGK